MQILKLNARLRCQAAHFLEERTISKKKLLLDDSSSCCSKTINLAHYQWLFKAVMQQWTKSMLQYSCQELDFPPTNSEFCDMKPPPQLFAQFFVDEETLKIWQHDIALQAEKDTLLLCHFAASTHIGISASATDQKPAKTCTCKGGSNATWRPTRRRRRATLSAKDPPCVHYQKSDHLFCESLFVPRWSRSMDFLHEVHFKNSCQKFSSAHLLVYVMRYFTCIYYRYSKEMLAFLQFLFLYFWVFF